MGCCQPSGNLEPNYDMKNTFSRRNNGLESANPNQKLTGSRVGVLALVFGLFVAAQSPGAAVPAPEKLLPEDTLVVLTVPAFAKMREVYQKSQPSQLWNDPAMKRFRDKFLSKRKEEF